MGWTVDFWNKIHRLEGHQICPFPLLKQNDKIARNPRETAQFLIKHYASVSATHNLPKETIAHQGQFERSHSNILNEPGDDLDSMNVEFTLSELKLAIGSRKKSAVGPDRVSYLMFGNMSELGQRDLKTQVLRGLLFEIYIFCQSVNIFLMF